MKVREKTFLVRRLLTEEEQTRILLKLERAGYNAAIETYGTCTIVTVVKPA